MTKNNAPDDKEAEEMMNLLKSLYVPGEEEIQDFSNFFDNIEQKLNEQNTLYKIDKTTRQIDSNFYSRQMKLENLDKSLEERKLKIHRKNINGRNWSNIIIALLGLSLTATTIFVSLNYDKIYQKIMFLFAG